MSQDAALRLRSDAAEPEQLQLPEIAARALAGDRAAERAVCDRLLPAIRAFARRRLTAAAAEDFAHDALLLLLQAIREGRIRDPQRLASFALGICRNLARERVRLDERRALLLRQFGLSEEDLQVEPKEPELRRAHLEDCLSQLTARAREVMQATFCDERVDAEIAAALQLTVNNVRVLRHRTLAALRHCLGRPLSWVQR